MLHIFTYRSDSVVSNAVKATVQESAGVCLLGAASALFPFGSIAVKQGISSACVEVVTSYKEGCS